MSRRLRAAFDPRLELLGVVQLLAEGAKGEGLKDVASEIEERFGAFRSHPAVQAYRSSPNPAYGLVSLFLSAPPQLAWLRDRRELPGDFSAGSGDPAGVERFLELLRAFSRESRFMEFFTSCRQAYGRWQAQAQKALDRRDYMKALEMYLGTKLQCRFTVLLSLLYAPRTFYSYILPYPQGDPVPKGPFEIYTITRAKGFARGRPDFGLERIVERGMLMEPLYLAVEPAFAGVRERLRACPDIISAMSGPGFSAWDQRAKHMIAAALYRRIFGSNGRRDSRAPQLRSLDGRLNRLLKDYEGDRAAYPSLPDFFPKMIDAFLETAALS